MFCFITWIVVILIQYQQCSNGITLNYASIQTLLDKINKYDLDHYIQTTNTCIKIHCNARLFNTRIV